MNMNKNQKQIRLKTISIMLIISMISSMGCVAADVDPKNQLTVGASSSEGTSVQSQGGSKIEGEAVSSYTKDETVYVNLDASGKPYQQTVVNWIHSDQAGAVIRDRTTLKEIENVKGDEIPERSGNDLTWKLDGTDLYYRGTTNAEPPVSVKITYRLDGKEYTPEEMAGKSGKMEMHLQFTNNLKRTSTIGGQPTEIYIPVMASAALVLPDDTFSNVEASDGTLQTDGNNQAVALVAMPGLEDSLKLDSYDIPGFTDNDLDFPSEFTITADVKEFSMGPIAIAMTTTVPELEKLDAAKDIDEMRIDLIDLKNAQDDLTRWDPTRQTRSLFTEPVRTEQARALVDDIFTFYDQDTEMFSLLPKYVTEENIDLLDRVQDDMEDIDIDSLLHSDALDNMIDQLTEQNIDRIRALLDDYYDIKKYDTEELDDLLYETGELLEQVKNNQASLRTFRVLMSHSDQFITLMDSLDNPTLKQFLKPEVLDTAIDAIGEQQAMATLKAKGLPTPEELNTILQTLQGSAELSSDQIAALNTVLGLAAQQGVDVSALSTFLPQYNTIRELIQSAMGKAVSVASAPTPATAQKPTPNHTNETDTVPTEKTESEEDTSTKEKEEEKEEITIGSSGEVGLELSTFYADGTEDIDSDEIPEDVIEELENPSPETDTDTDEIPEDTLDDDQPDTTDTPDTPQEEEGSTSNPIEDTIPETSTSTPDPTPDQDIPTESTTPETPTIPDTPTPDPTPSPVIPGFDKIVEQFEQGRQGLIQVTGAVKGSIETQVEEEVSKQTAPLKAQMRGLLGSVNGLKGEIDNELGGETIAKQRIRQAIDFTQEIIPSLEKIMDRSDAMLDKISDENDKKTVEDLIKEMRSMIKDLENNESNIAALQRLLDHEDELDLQNFRVNWSTLKQDILDAKPILDDLQADMDEQVINNSVHASPETVDVLLKMKEDMFQYRDISEILRDSLEPDKVQTATRMFSTFDRLQNKGSADKYVNQIDDVDSLLERKDAIMDVADGYRIYTDAAPEADTSVKFVMKTDEIKKPDTTKKEDSTSQEPANEKHSFTEWAKGLVDKIKKGRF